MRQRSHQVSPLEDAVLLVERSEQIAVAGDRLRQAEEEEPVGPERVVEDRYKPGLQLRLEIDQQIAAGNQIEARERRIAENAFRKEGATVPHILSHAVNLRVRAVESLQ